MVCQSAPPASSPAPRLRARSMLSLGTEFFLAFWMASYSVGLPAGSPPPTRAATSMFLIKRAKFLPRRASMIAFLCLVVAHLEWPLMQVLPLSLTSDPINESTWTFVPYRTASGAVSSTACLAICGARPGVSAVHSSPLSLHRSLRAGRRTACGCDGRPPPQDEPR